MAILTCVNLNTSTYHDIIINAATLGMTPSRLVALLLGFVMTKKRLTPQIFQRVKYQEVDPGGNWEILHVRLQGDEYKKALDLKKLLKMSVSFIVANAVKDYLHILIFEHKQGVFHKQQDNSSNYYLFISHFSDNVKYFIVSWMPIEEKNIQVPPFINNS